jgi:hypothetical protein
MQKKAAATPFGMTNGCGGNDGGKHETACRQFVGERTVERASLSVLLAVRWVFCT